MLGSTLVTNPEFAREAAKRYSDCIVAGIDAKDGMVAIEGWREGTGTPAADLVAELKDFGIHELIYTDISRDGMQTGIDAAAYGRLAQVAGFPITASGGIATLDGHPCARGAAGAAASTASSPDAPSTRARSASRGRRVCRQSRKRRRVTMLTKRVIPCLDVKDGRVVKGVNFVNLRDAGDPVELANAYDAQGADEVVFLDITATSDGAQDDRRHGVARERGGPHPVCRGRRLQDGRGHARR